MNVSADGDSLQSVVLPTPLNVDQTANSTFPPPRDAQQYTAALLGC